MAVFGRVLLLVTVVSFCGRIVDSYKVCAKPGFHHECSQLLRFPDVQCQDNLHGIDCLLNIQHGKSDFGRVTADEALIAANFLDVVVIGETRSDAIRDEELYSTVVLVKKDYPGGLKNLRDKKYCHPGFKYDGSISDLLLKEFERAVLKEGSAENCAGAVLSDTLAEREIKSLSEFFGPSCRPGPWSESDDLNTAFYERYSKLCELCNDTTSARRCTVPNGKSPFMYALECLLRVDGGDVALTTLNTVHEFFDKAENSGKKSLYKSLCRDGTTKSLDSPCVWSRQPWNIIVANKSNANAIRSSLSTWLPNSIIESSDTSTGIGVGRSAIEQFLAPIIFPDRTYNKLQLVDEVPLKKYIETYRRIPDVDSSVLCGQTVRWCTISDAEQEKCQWLAQASLDRAIQPAIVCVRGLSKIDCLDKIQNNQSQVVMSDAHYGYVARKKNLAPIAYPDTDAGNVIQTLLIVKNTSTVQSFEDLKGKKGCFPEYGGIEWVAFLNTGRNLKSLPGTCDYDNIMNNFLSDSCIPGTHDRDHEVSPTADREKLCRLCLPAPTGTAVTCNTDETNLYYGNQGALRCLKEVGDFAVITKSDYPNIDPTEFRVLCRNGTLSEKPGFGVDQSCSLSVTVDSEVVTRSRQPNSNRDVGIVLLNFERRFGTDRNKAFEVFNVFNGTLDLLFKDSTPGLVKTDSSNVYVRNYAELFAHTDQCLRTPSPSDDKPGNEPGGAQALTTPFVTILISLTLFLSKLYY